MGERDISRHCGMVALTLTSHGLYPDAAAEVTTLSTPLPPPAPVPPVLYLLVAPPEPCGYEGGGGGGAW